LVNGSDAVKAMKEIPRRRITFTSSSNKIFTEQLGKRVVVRGRGVILRTPPPPFYNGLLDIYIKDDVNGFFSTLDTCCMVKTRLKD
jgi:hypothetical protein